MSNLHQLWLDNLLLSSGDEEALAQHDGFALYTLATDADFGNAEPVTSEIASELMFGSVERITGWGNRDMKFRVQVASESANGLALGQQAVELACRSARELRWTPPAKDGAVTVHDLHFARVEGVFDDLEESAERGIPVRTMLIHMRAMPFPRSDVLTVVPPLASGTGTTVTPPVVNVLNPATSSTGWSAWTWHTPPQSLTVVSAALGVGNLDLAPAQGVPADVRYTGTWSMAGDRWLRVKYRASAPHNLGISLMTNLGMVSRSPSARIDEYAYYLLPAGVTTITRAQFLIPPGGWLRVAEVARQNQAPSISNTRQQVMQFEVGGSADTECSIALSHATLPLGQVMVYTWPADESGYVPPIGQYLTSGDSDSVVDATAVMGRYLPITNSSSTKRTFDVPVGMLPEGTYSVAISAKAATAGGIFVRATASTLLGGIGQAVQVEEQYLQWTTTHRVQSIGQLTLPPALVPRGSVAKVRIEISHSTPTAELRLDNVYLLNVDTGDLTFLDCGTSSVAPGFASSKAWIDAPTVDRPHSTIWVGTQADRSDARHISGLFSVPCLQHSCEPGQMGIMVVSNAPDVATTASYYARSSQSAVA